MAIGQKLGRMLSWIGGKDNLGAERVVNTVVRGDGLTALAMDGQVTVTSTFGFDQQPDSYFQIVNTGAAGNTWTISIAATTADPSTPDRDVPAYTKVFTVQAGEVGDEMKFRDRMIQELNADTVFKNTVFLKAQKASDRAVVHILSTKFSVSGEFWERPMAGDFNVSVTGTAVVIVGFDNLISRSKPVTISRDLNSPHRLGLFGITGNVFVSQKDLSDLFYGEALRTTSPFDNNMLVNGSTTPVNFRINALSTTDLFIEHLWFYGGGNSIKFDQFLSKSSPAKLPNGILVTVKSDDIITTFPVIQDTQDFKNKWSALSGDAANFRVDVQSAADQFVAILTLPNPFLLRVAGSFTTDDYINVSIRDDLSAGIKTLGFSVKGFEKEP
jgi:hypothetical protein